MECCTRPFTLGRTKQLSRFLGSTPALDAGTEGPKWKSYADLLKLLILRAVLKRDVDATAPNAVATDLEEQIATLQVKLNALRSTTPEVSEAATKQPDKATLRKQVEQAFDVRQQLQELEAQKLRLKLQLIEANLNTRQKNRDGIIERRVEELLDPNGEVDGMEFIAENTGAGGGNRE